MYKLLHDLQKGRILLSDGATGTALQQRGLPTGVCIEEWNRSHPTEVESVFAEYIAAGSDIIETNSFGGTRFKLAHYGLSEQAFELNRLAAEISRRAAGKDRYVFGSVGPSGEFMAPLGTRSEADMYETYKEQAMGLAAGGADAICIETMMALEEALVALRAAKENTPLPVVVTFTFDKTATGDFRTMMGVSIDQVAKELPAAGADIIGSNCGHGMEQMVEVCRRFRKATDVPLMIQANAGLPVIENGQTIFRATPAEMAAGAGELIHAGANIIGGCCGTNAAHIAAMRAVVPSQ